MMHALILYALALAAGLLLAVFARWAFLPAAELPRHRVRTMRIRLRLRLHPGRGHATAFELWLRWGRFAAWRKAGQTRPSLSVWQRCRARQVSVFMGRAQYRLGLRLPLEEHAVVMAPPRAWKTAYLAAVVLHYPGAVVATTTKPDVFALTSGVRARRGPVAMFNPEGIGGVPSTFRWNPVDGCAAPAVAIRRADLFAGAVSTEGVDDASFWTDKGSSYMRGIFHAAALVQGDMRLVARWAFGDVSDAQDVLASGGSEQWALELGELHSEAQKTAATIRMILSRSLQFLADPALAQAVLPDGEPFDIPGFLAGSGTLYMVARSDRDNSPLAPLFAMLAGEVHWQASQIASRAPGGRLDPPLLMALDEIVQTCPVPLPKWAADSGGKGIQLISVTHGEAQLESRWKAAGKQTILDTAGALVILPGVKDVRTLDMVAKLCGQASFKVRGQEHHSLQDVMAPDMVRQMPVRHGLILRGNLAPVIAKLPVAWKDRTYKRARRAGYATAELTPVPAVAMDTAGDRLAVGGNDTDALAEAQAAAWDPVGGDWGDAREVAMTAAEYPWSRG